MGVTQKAKEAYARYEKLKKAKGQYDTAKGYVETIKKILDEDTRKSELFKQGLKYMTKLGEKVVGPILTKHPYFTFHKLHLEALGKALTATDTHQNAMKALKAAIASSDATHALANQVSRLELRKNALKLGYATLLYGLMNLRIDLQHNPDKAAPILKDAGYTPQTLETRIQTTLFDWRAEACDLFFDSANLFAMVDIEYRAASVAFARYTARAKKLKESNNSIERIAGHAAERDRQYEVVDRLYNGGSAPPEASYDPSIHAQRQRDNVAAVMQTLTMFCDVAMSHEAYYPLTVHVRPSSL